MVEPLLPEVTLPVLVLAGSEDHMLPSVDEAARLYDMIPTCQQVCFYATVLWVDSPFADSWVQKYEQLTMVCL